VLRLWLRAPASLPTDSNRPSDHVKTSTRQVKYLNNIIERDHRRIKRLTAPGLGFGSFQTARRTLAGFEAMAMIRKGQVTRIEGNDMTAQTTFVSNLFQVAA
jgi:IS6 family transposase